MRLFWLNGSVVLEPQSQEEPEALRVVSESFATVGREYRVSPGRVEAGKLNSSSDLIGSSERVI